MAKGSCFIGIVASGGFSAMSYFVMHVKMEEVSRNQRMGYDYADELFILFLGVGFWLGCGALAWHFIFMLFRK